jgi:uncharacterized protein YndB with AHSA1/START domain
MELNRVAVFAAALALLASPARAEVVSASPSAFVVRTEAVTQASPEQAWRALGQIGNWWNSAHTYSGDSGNLSLAMRAGGCFCERWARGQSVEHGRVVLAMEREGVRTLRFIGALGPLQEIGVTGVMTFVIAPDPGGAKITMSYRVAGDAALGLDALAPPVDGVLTEQFARLVGYSNTGEAAR